ncbi:3-dehydroquinate synthase [Blastopirellula marina]|uniref:3-dehydroquinate synthase n=1 Tax=Blastopirellula marina DSM 3645 TaxID=314230 RepID=A3ZWV1_9BACT|nr:3-dehydroquinate synthase [Blastopirellula marina]EAQ79075.1 3-dehydroquinate synthase [Blastopirellula marina DSM 3645]
MKRAALTAEHEIVRVQLSERSYDIAIGAGIIDTAPPFFSARAKISHAVLVTDDQVRPLYADRIAAACAASGMRTTLLSVPAGETSKSIAMADQLWNQCLAEGADRKTVVIAVGGGVIGDLAGFIAATFARGLSFFQVPTTLLAQVDSSVGGKVGVNLPTAKNMVGAFWQPQGVLIDVDVLATLPEREYRAGMAEVVKYGVILDPDFFAYLEANVASIQLRDRKVLTQVIARCCQLKADVVQADERETTGLRAVLNYGHTFCHAFEATCGYGQLLHGEAVSIGMLCASRLAESLGRISPDVTQRQRKLLSALGLPTVPPQVDIDLVMTAMQRDKKVEHGKLQFVLPTKLGMVELVGDVPVKLAKQAINDG